MDDSNPLDDTDSIWGVSDEVTIQEWSKMDEDFTNAGYREGITAGKESALQEGFDEGFANIGAPLGKEVGMLKGLANAITSFLSVSGTRAGSPEAVERLQEEIRNIVGGLDRIHLVDLAPRDLQAEEHAREHLENGPAGVQVPMTAGVNSIGPSKIEENGPESLHGETIRPTRHELERLRVRLSIVLEELGLDIPLD